VEVVDDNAMFSFNKSLPKNLKKFSMIWILLLSSLPWIAWQEHNNIFSNKSSGLFRRFIKLFEGALIAYSRIDWQSALVVYEGKPIGGASSKGWTFHWKLNP
jgi:hypothetical protein